MVKTRHSGDIDVESPPKFLSLANEKSRQSLKSGDATGDGSGRQSTGAYGDSRDAYSIFEEKVVESRLRPRIGPSRAYNYLDVDSSDEEIIRGRRVRRHSLDEFSSERRRSGYSRSRQIKQELLDEQQGRSRRMLRGRRSSREELEMSMEDEDFEEPNNHRRKRRNHSEVLDESEDRGEDKQMRGRMTRRRQHSIEDDQEDSEISQRRNPRRRQQGSREEDKERVDSHTTRAQGSSRRQLDTTEEDEEQLIRRSSRTRRQVYDTLNQSFLVNIPGRSKHDSDDNQDHSDGKDQDTDDNKEFSDMYSRVKRKRVQVKRNMYGVPVNDDSDSDQDIAKRNKNNNKQDDEEDDDEENEEDEEEENDKDNRRITRQNRMPLRKKQPEIVKSYSLREHKPRTDLYKAPVEERRIKRIHHSIFAVTPTKKNTSQTYHSPAQRRNIRKRSALHSSSSSTSSSESESNDEKSFRRRKAKSMAKARSRMMPMNFAGNDIPSASVLKDRIKSGASLADVEPMNIDRSVTFNSIGGLGKHIRALKEMVVFPLLYDKVFQRFKVDPPRGVLFYGPPGTGKTLVARALANECSQGDRRVAFFMRKGADCLSKWVGESERQLRLLFDQAYKFRPSIIFFDEIDGLAPVRSSRQDQIHSSIVSTLLALMDGLDSRGEIVVIGATNRIDSLDPALRRPGRFDREFFFPLPSLEARKQILKIHTTCWTPKLNDQFTSELAEKCVGYCGADLKALCTEAAMLALRRRYPQIYITNEALQLDVSSINVSAKDFFDAIGNIIPTSQRAVNTPARALTARVYPLLHRQLDKVLNQLSDTFPLCLAQTASLDAAVTTSQAEALAESGFIWEELASDEDEDAPSIFVPSTSSKGSRSNRRSTDDGPSTSSQTVPTYLNFTSYATSRPATFRPRLMLVGKEGQGQTTYIAPAVVHKMENLPVHVLDLPALYAVTAKTPEESCANVFHEAKRKCPSIVYLPYINQWWDVMAETLRATLLTLIQDLDPTIPLLLLATSEQPYHTLDPQLQCLFSQISGEVIQMTDPNMEERRTFFKDLLLRQACRPPPQKKQAAQRMLEVLPKAAAPKPRELTKEELKALVEKEELTLMELRIFLRDVLNKLGSDKKFSIFAKPVNIEDAPDYYEIIEQPMDLSTMMGKIDLHEYNTVRAFMHDIDLICSNALEYNPNRGPMDRVIRHRACALKDTAYAIIKTELDKDFEKTCVEIEESRKRRGEKSTTIPDFYYTRPKNQQQTSRQSQPVIPSYLQISKPVRSIPKPEGERFSRRVRGLTTDPVPSLETVEKVYRTSKSCNSPTRDKNNSNEDSSTPGPSEPTKSASQSDKNDHSLSVKKDSTPVQKEEKKSDEIKSGEANKSSSASSKKRKNKCVWCRPRRKRPKILAFRQASRASGDEQQGSGDEHGEEEMSAEEEEDEQSQDSQGPETSEQLVVDTSEHDESAELKSPSRISTRKSPATSNPGSRVSTRRNSMSPHSASHSHTSPSTQTQGNTDHTEPSKEVEETTTATQSTSPAEKEKKTGKPETDTGTHDVEDLTEPIRQNSSPPSEPLDKSRVVKRLDLDSVAVDSGVGSSVDSNGDSRDSMDHRGEGDSSIAAASVFTPAHTPAQDSNQNCTTTTELQNKASAILNEPNQKIVVDNNRLSSLLNRLVARTDGYNVERLEKIYSHLSQIIYRHRHEYNRAGMIVNLERKVDELTKIHPPGSSTTPY